MQEPKTSAPINPFKKLSASSKRATAYGLVAIVLSLLALLTAWFSTENSRDLIPQIKFFATHLSEQHKAAFGTHEKRINTIQSSIHELQTDVDALGNRINDLSSSNAYTNQQRTLDEVRYLTHMAKMQLSINHDPEQALNLLKLAREQMNAANTTQFIELRNALSKDILALEDLPKLDYSHLLASLDKLKSEVNQLPAFTATPLEQTTASSKNSEKNWQQQLQNSLGSLKKMVIIRHHTTIKPLLSDQQLIFLKQNVELKLSQAEWALLYQKPSVYLSSLEAAKKLLTENYPNASALNPIESQLDTLSKINIAPELPDLTETLKLLTSTSPIKKEPINKVEPKPEAIKTDKS